VKGHGDENPDIVGTLDVDDAKGKSWVKWRRSRRKG